MRFHTHTHARLLITMLLGLAACDGDRDGGGTGAGQLTIPGSADAPDIVLLSVSGRCDSVVCTPPADNQPYLGLPGDAAEAIAAALAGAGQDVLRADYIAALYDYDDNGDGRPDRFGFLSLVADLQAVSAHWIDGADAPARIVIVAHSHGCVWAHIACSVVPQVPIDVLISLDANCLLWATDYGSEVLDHLVANGNPYGWNISQPCDQWAVPGLDPQDTEDIAFDNVEVNLEVRSAGLITDFQANHRLDGSQQGIATFDAPTDDHGGVHDPAGESIPWVLDQLAQLGY